MDCGCNTTTTTTSALSLYEIRQTVKHHVQRHLGNDGSVTLVMGYYLQTVALVFRRDCERPKRWHRPPYSVTCYKAMDLLEWERLWQGVLSLSKPRGLIVFHRTPDMTCRHVLHRVKVFDDPRLLISLECLYPHHLGNDIDVFEALAKMVQQQQQRHHPSHPLPVPAIGNDNNTEETPMTEECVWHCCPSSEQSHITAMNVQTVVDSDDDDVDEDDDYGDHRSPWM